MTDEVLGLLLRKNYTAKAVTAEGGEGVFKALVSVFGNEDSQGDIVEKGAYADTLKAWSDKERPIPVLWSHDFGDPDSILGYYTKAEETDAGLEMTGQLDMDHPKAARVHKLMKQGLITEFSMSGLVTDYDEIREKSEDADDDDPGEFKGLKIKAVDLWEAGPCFKGANPNTTLLSVKSATENKTSVPPVFSKEDLEKLKSQRDALDVFITAVEAANDKPKEDARISTGEAAQKSAVSPAVRALLDIDETEKDKKG